MTKANIELPNGTKITVEGTPEDVSKTIRLMQGEKVETAKKHVNTPKKKEKKESYSGTSGGIRLLINEGFLDSPKLAKEIQAEMIRQGYHYSISSISKLLSVNFMKKTKQITRMKEDNKWKYVVRK